MYKFKVKLSQISKTAKTRRFENSISSKTRKIYPTALIPADTNYLLHPVLLAMKALSDTSASKFLTLFGLQKLFSSFLLVTRHDTSYTRALFWSSLNHYRKHSSSRVSTAIRVSAYHTVARRMDFKNIDIADWSNSDNNVTPPRAKGPSILDGLNSQDLIFTSDDVFEKYNNNQEVETEQLELIKSSPQQVPVVDWDLEQLVNDPGWGFTQEDVNSQKKASQKMDDQYSDFSIPDDILLESMESPKKNSQSKPLFTPKSNKISSSIMTWSESPDWHKTETLNSRRNKFKSPYICPEVSDIPLKASIALKPLDINTVSAPESAIPSSPSPLHNSKPTSQVDTECKQANKVSIPNSTKAPVLPAPCFQSNPVKPARQAKLTTFISPLLIQKAHASTLAEDKAAAVKVAEKSSKAKGQLAPIFLSEEQRRILSMVVDERRNIFFTGAAGTGKSVLLRRIISEMRKKYQKSPFPAVAVTASTGLAACNIGGMTLHSFGGIGLGEDTVLKLVEKIRRNRKANKRWKQTKVLIIDEISMIDGDLFDKLEQVAKIIRKSDQPFGGIQIVMTGDFYQLPPVFKPPPAVAQTEFAAGNNGFQVEATEEGKFSFEANSWTTVIDTTVELKQVFRQKDDKFSSMLNNIRGGTVTDEIEREFRNLSRPVNVPGDITATELFPLRKDVDWANGNQMKKLPGQIVEYTAQDSYNTEWAKQNGKLDLLMCPKVLHVKKGAQVMLVKNLDETLVNGSLGKIIGFMSESSFELIKELPEDMAEKVIRGKVTAQTAMEEYIESSKNETKKSSRDPFGDINQLLQVESARQNENPVSREDYEIDEEVPVKIGIKVTKHDVPKKNPGAGQQHEDTFGLSRLDEDEIENDFHHINWKRKKELIDMLNNNTANVGRKWPYVRFTMTDGTTRDLLVQPETWTLEDSEGVVEATRSQVPLILAWAISIHKSQGQTMEWVKVDLRKVFEAGQSYVALSRAVRMDGLQVLGFARDKIRVHPKVIDFYKNLKSALEVPEEVKTIEDEEEKKKDKEEEENKKDEDEKEYEVGSKKRRSKEKKAKDALNKKGTSSKRKRASKKNKKEEEDEPWYPEEEEQAPIRLRRNLFA